MYYGEIKTCDIANGVGVRVTLFVSGCTNHCYNCFQPQTWDFHYGKPFDAAAEQVIFAELEKPFIRGLTLLGGDPFEPENQRALVPFLHRVRAQYPDQGHLGVFGFHARQGARGRRHAPALRGHGRDALAHRHPRRPGATWTRSATRLRFRGSENQRIIDMNRDPRGGPHRTLGGHERMEVKIQKLRPGAVTPRRGSADAAGYDLYACPADGQCVTIAPHATAMIGTGLALAIPAGYFGGVFARSGWPLSRAAPGQLRWRDRRRLPRRVHRRAAQRHGRSAHRRPRATASPNS